MFDYRDYLAKGEENDCLYTCEQGYIYLGLNY